MRRVLICTGVLGGGTAVVFALAALTATLFPNGTVVPSSWGGGVWVGKGGMAEPMPMPVPVEEAPRIDPGMVVEDQGFEALPGDATGAAPGVVVAEPALP